MITNLLSYFPKLLLIHVFNSQRKSGSYLGGKNDTHPWLTLTRWDTYDFNIQSHNIFFNNIDILLKKQMNLFLRVCFVERTNNITIKWDFYQSEWWFMANGGQMFTVVKQSTFLFKIKTWIKSFSNTPVSLSHESIVQSIPITQYRLRRIW